MTILEWLEAITPFIIAISTVVYATLTYFLLRETRREKKKPVIEEMLKVVIHPLLNDVQKEIYPLRQKRFEWHHESKGTFLYHELIPRKSGEEGIIYEHFSRTHPRIPLLLNHHDVEFHHLKNSLENLANELLSVGFKEKCMELITEYNQGTKRERYPSVDVVYLLMFVIDNAKEVPKAHIVHEFWDTSGAQLLSFRDKTDMKEHIETVEYKRRELLHTCEELEAELKRLINQFRDKYGIEIVGSKTV